MAITVEIPKLISSAITSHEQNLNAISDAKIDVVVERRVADVFRIESQSRWRRSGGHDRVDVVFTNMEKAEDTLDRHVVWDRDSLSGRLRYFDARVLVPDGDSGQGNRFVAFESNFGLAPYYLSSSGVEFASAREGSPHHIALALMLAPVHNYGLREVFETAQRVTLDEVDASGITATVVPPDESSITFRVHFRSDKGFLIDRVQAWADDSKAGDGVPKLVTEFIEANGSFCPKKLVRLQGGTEIERVTVTAEFNGRQTETLEMVEFPEGCRVEDHVNGKFHVWGSSCPKVSFDSYDEIGRWCFQKKEKEIADQEGLSNSESMGGPRA